MIHTTNYLDTLIQPSEDCVADAGTVPAKPDTVADMQYALLAEAPYTLTSDDLLVAMTAARRDIPVDKQDALRAEIFAKGQPCLRASPLVKSYGWAMHHNALGRVALVGCETADYDRMMRDPAIAKIKGMRSKRA